MYRSSYTKPRIAAIAVIAALSVISVCGNTLTRELNVLRVGDSLRRYSIEYTDTVSQGDERVWDLSDTKELGRADVRIDALSDSLPVFGIIAGRTVYYYSLRGDSLTADGFENNQSKMTYYRRETALTFPFRFGSRASGKLEGKGIYCERYHQYLTGDYSTAADAEGRIIFPGGDTVDNAVRVHTVRLFKNVYVPIIQGHSSGIRRDSITMRHETSRWYAPGYRYPLLEISVAINTESGATLLKTAHYTPPSEMAVMVDDACNETVRHNMAQRNHSPAIDDNGGRNRPPVEGITDYGFVQNRDNRSVTVSFGVDRDADVEVILADATGITYRVEKRHCAPGTQYSVTMDYGGLPYSTAAFVLYISVNGQKGAEKFYR